MPLEEGTYIQDLVETNPVGATDERRFGDDHLRLIKKVLKNTFPDAHEAIRNLRMELRTSDTILTQSDQGKYIFITSPYTQTFASAVTLGGSWWIRIRNLSTGNVVLDPAGSEVINIGRANLSTFTMYPGEDIMVVSDSSALYAIGFTDRVLMETKTGPFGATIPFLGIGALAPRFRTFELEWQKIFPSVNPGQHLVLQTSTNNGAAWIGTGYFHVRLGAVHSGVVTATGAENDIYTILVSGVPVGLGLTGMARIVPAAGRVFWDTDLPGGAGLAYIQGWSTIDAGSNAVALWFSNGNATSDGNASVRLYGIA